MAYAYEVYCYYNVETLAAVFNGVASIVNGGGYANLIKTVLTLGVIIMALVSLSTGKFEGMKWFVVAMIFYFGFLGPKTNVMLIDRIAVQPPQVIANVPIGLAFMAHTTSSMGDWMTVKMESAFSVLPNTLKFGADPSTANVGETHGLVFGLNLLRETQRAVIADPALRMDMYEFVKNCTVYDILSGRIDPLLLTSSNDLMATMSSTSVVRLTIITSSPGVQTTLACNLAHASLLNRLGTESTNQAVFIGRGLNPNLPASTSNAAVAAMLGGQVADMTGLMYGISQNAQANIRQNMVLNLMNSSGAVIGQQLNDPAAVSIALAQARAEASANSSYATMAKVAEGAMPKIRNVIEVVIYATFPIVMLIILIAGHRAGGPLKAYFMTMVWLQLWPPLYAILNLVVTMEAAKQSAAIALAHGGGVSIMSAADIGQVALSSQAIAGYMVMLIPVIAGAITKGGEQAMTSLASSLTAPMQQSASKVGAEHAAGELKLGNTSFGTHAANNTSMNNHKSIFSTDAGAAATQMTDANNNTVGISASGKTFVAEGKNSLNQTAQASIDQSKTSQRNADIAHSESVKSGTTVGESMGNAYKLMTGSAKDRAHGIELLSTAGHTSNAVAGSAFEKMQSVISEDARSVGLDAKDVVQFQAGIKTGLSGSDALEGVMASKGITGGGKAGWLAMLAKNTGASLATTEGVSTALSKQLNHSDKTSSADAYKTLNTLQDAAQFGYQVGDKSSAGSKSSEGVNAELNRAHEARRSQEISHGEEKKWGERASREEKIGKLLGQDVLQSANADKELKALGQSIGNKQLAEGGVVAFVGMSDQSRMGIAQQLLQARDEGMSQLGGDLSPNATAALKEGAPAGGNAGAQADLYAKGSAGSKERFGTDSSSALTAHSPGVTESQLKAVQKAETEIAATNIKASLLSAEEGQTETAKQQAVTQQLVADGVTAPNLYAKTLETAAHSPGMVTAGTAAVVATVAASATSLIPDGTAGGGNPAKHVPNSWGGMTPNPSSASTAMDMGGKLLKGVGYGGAALAGGYAVQDMYSNGINSENATQLGLSIATVAHPVGAAGAFGAAVGQGVNALGGGKHVENGFEKIDEVINFTGTKGDKAPPSV